MGKVLPEITDKMIPDSTEYNAKNLLSTNYKLPQKGTTVKLNANEAGTDNAVLFKLAWNGVKFELKK